ncbi:MAG: hypothetical protein M1400_01185 [Patescibacteria group bacterium]|nr:hypothetical protein [Patescibacteria group bacterium]
MKILNKKIRLAFLSSAVFVAFSMVGLSLPKSAQAFTPGLIPVGGRFLPGLFDIYTPSIVCGVQVSVAGPRPGVFTFLPIMVYRYFYMTPWHVGLNMVGNAALTPPCPPTLFMFGSSLTPGF